MDKIIEIKNLSKSFGEIKAVQNISFSVKEGELFAFLGVNGAGKSTTINIMCGQMAKDGGEITIDGLHFSDNYAEIKSRFGVVFQNSVLDKALSVKDNLKSRAALYGLFGEAFEHRVRELADLLDFSDLLKRTVGKLSGGQRRRIDIARALIHKPKILILDEPTTGLDPQTRKLLWKVIDDLRKSENMTVFLTTHYMEEAAEADYVVILDNGNIVAEGTPLQLKNKYSGDFVTVYGVEDEDISKLGVEVEKIKNGVRFMVSNTSEATRIIVENPEIFTDYEISKGKMDDIFLAVTGKKLMGGNDK